MLPFAVTQNCRKVLFVPEVKAKEHVLVAAVLTGACPDAPGVGGLPANAPEQNTSVVKTSRNFLIQFFAGPLSTNSEPWFVVRCGTRCSKFVVELDGESD